MKKIINFVFIIAFSLIISGCGKKPTTTITPTPTPKLVEIPAGERPYISLVPRSDGHMIYLKIKGVPSYVSELEYELLYTAKDGNMEIEKGLGDTIKNITTDLDRDLLLGTESCTNGCKYKYDEGVSGGTLTLNFINKNGQVSTFETPFTLKTGADIKKDNGINLASENFTKSPEEKLVSTDNFILLKQYKGGYSIFTSGQSKFATDYPQP